MLQRSRVAALLLAGGVLAGCTQGSFDSREGGTVPAAPASVAPEVARSRPEAPLSRLDIAGWSEATGIDVIGSCSTETLDAIQAAIDKRLNAQLSGWVGPQSQITIAHYGSQQLRGFLIDSQNGCKSDNQARIDFLANLQNASAVTLRRGTVSPSPALSKPPGSISATEARLAEAYAEAAPLSQQLAAQEAQEEQARAAQAQAQAQAQADVQAPAHSAANRSSGGGTGSAEQYGCSDSDIEAATRRITAEGERRLGGGMAESYRATIWVFDNMESLYLRLQEQCGRDVSRELDYVRSERANAQYALSQITP